MSTLSRTSWRSSLVRQSKGETEKSKAFGTGGLFAHRAVASLNGAAGAAQVGAAGGRNLPMRSPSLIPRSILGPLLFALAALGPAMARADEADGTRWRCWYDRAQHVACHLEQAAPDRALHGVPAATPSTSAGARARELPAVVADLRQQPARWRGRTVRIPLHTEPIDDTLTAELAQAVLCGSLSGCRVDYERDPVFSLQARADLADRYDWLLQPAE
jgi:hypothetical protein